MPTGVETVNTTPCTVLYCTVPVKRHRGEPGHTRDTRTHKGTRTAQTSLTTIQTHQQLSQPACQRDDRSRGRLNSRRPGADRSPRPTQKRPPPSEYSTGTVPGPGTVVANSGRVSRVANWRLLKTDLQQVCSPGNERKTARRGERHTETRAWHCAIAVRTDQSHPTEGEPTRFAVGITRHGVGTTWAPKLQVPLTVL